MRSEGTLFTCLEQVGEQEGGQVVGLDDNVQPILCQLVPPLYGHARVVHQYVHLTPGVKGQ